jgi:hypothetical protein
MFSGLDSDIYIYIYIYIYRERERERESIHAYIYMYIYVYIYIYSIYTICATVLPNVAVAIKQNVFRLKVPIDNIHFVQVLQC